MFDDNEPYNTNRRPQRNRCGPEAAEGSTATGDLAADYDDYSMMSASTDAMSDVELDDEDAEAAAAAGTPESDMHVSPTQYGQEEARMCEEWELIPSGSQTPASSLDVQYGSDSDRSPPSFTESVLSPVSIEHEVSYTNVSDELSYPFFDRPVPFNRTFSCPAIVYRNRFYAEVDFELELDPLAQSEPVCYPGHFDWAMHPSIDYSPIRA